jgi:hypothetical protein
MPSLPRRWRAGGVILRGNRRTVIRQYAARKYGNVRVLPGIAGYCRVVGPWDFSTTDLPATGASTAGEHRWHAGSETGAPADGPLTVRLGPLGTAWGRIYFFLRAEMWKKTSSADCGVGLRGHNLLGMSEKVGLCRFRTSAQVLGAPCSPAVLAPVAAGPWPKMPPLRSMRSLWLNPPRFNDLTF